jgi:hypothetical protein
VAATSKLDEPRSVTFEDGRRFVRINISHGFSFWLHLKYNVLKSFVFRGSIEGLASHAKKTRFAFTLARIG